MRWLLALLACGGAPVPEPLTHPAQTPWSVDGADGPEVASCASCHHADAGGRPDGSIPRLAGQRASVLTAKLDRIADGAVHLPVMLPFARALDADARHRVATTLAELPRPQVIGTGDGGALDRGATAYAGLCAGCHGAAGEGRDAPPTPALCGQHHAYIVRRALDAAAGTRTDVDPAMAALVRALSPDDLDAIADHLSRCGGAE